MEQMILSSISLDELVDKIASEVQGRLTTHAQPAPVENEFITREETAKRLGLSLPTLNEYTKNGIIPAYRIGSRVRYKSGEVEAALKQVQTIKGRRA